MKVRVVDLFVGGTDPVCGGFDWNVSFVHLGGSYAGVYTGQDSGL